MGGIFGCAEGAQQQVCQRSSETGVTPIIPGGVRGLGRRVIKAKGKEVYS